MEPILQAMAALTWQAALAILGSVVAVVTGLFGYLIKVHSSEKHSKLPPDHVENLHSRISELKDRVSSVEADSKVALSKMESIEKQLDDHEGRDERDFAQLNEKIDKVTDILLKILTDQKL